MTSPLQILFVEDEATDMELALRELHRGGIRCEGTRVETEEALRRALQGSPPDIILSDFSFPGAFDGMAALAVARSLAPETPFVFISGTIGEERAIDAIKRGAVDYVLKSNLRRLPTAVDRAVQQAHMERSRLLAEQRLQESEQRFSSFMKHLPGAAFMKDSTGRYVFANESFAREFADGVDSVLGRTDDELWPAERAAVLTRNDREVLRTGRIVSGIEEVAQGEVTRYWLVHKFPVPVPDRRKTLLGGIALDFTQRRIAEQKVARLSRIHAVLSGINSAIVRIRSRRELFNEACRIAVEYGGFAMAWIGVAETGNAGCTPVAWRGDQHGYLAEVGALNDAAPDDPGITAQLLQGAECVVANDIARDPALLFKEQALNRGFKSMVALALRTDNELAGTLTLFAAELDYFDETELELLKELAGDISFALDYIGKEERLNYLAFYDNVTGLANRRLFGESLSQALAGARSDQRTISVILLDVDRFRIINDSLGRHSGDAVLKLVAGWLQRESPEPESVARISADCFGVALRDNRQGALAHFLDRVCDTSGITLRVDGRELIVTLTAGVSVYPDDGDSADALIRNAEAALKKAKASGDRCMLYAPQMNALLIERLSLEHRLRRAVEKEQFVLHYQPKIDMRSRRLCGFEALLRWNDPQQGLIPPGTFITVLEETGLMQVVGRWVLDKAAQASRRWSEMGFPRQRVAVNISAVQLRQRTFVRDIADIVDTFGERPCTLDLELTESILIEDLDANIGKLNEVRGLGVGIAIDDFGTGYSSLSYIARLPVDTLKIDRSFVADVGVSPQAVAIVSSIISLARNLDMEIVAEGVETEEQAHLLSLLKCNIMQGYLFAKPATVDEVDALLQSQGSST